MKAKPLFILVILLFFFSPLSAQPFPDTQWGIVRPEEWKISRCSYDTSATALVLFDQGDVEDHDQGVITRRYKRIKILASKGISEGDIFLPFYAKGYYERIYDVEAQTINLDASGKEDIQRVAIKQIFDVKENERWREKRFSFPAVKVGSIIEYRYTTFSRSFDDWIFQDNLPTLYSEFKVHIPKIYHYLFLMQGSQMLNKYKHDSNSDSWSLQNLPALKSEPFVYCYQDYAEKLQIRNTESSWAYLVAERLVDDNYTRYLRRPRLVKEIISKVLTGHESALEKAKKLYGYVQNTITWNEQYAWFTQHSLSDMLERQKGNGADINLLLVLLLREAGLEANPLLISTRENGIITQKHAFLSQFNHLLANVRIQEKDYLLDAIDRLRPFDYLAEADLVEAGLLLDGKKPRWIEIPGAPESKQTTFIEADLSDPEKPTYKVDLRYTGYLAMEQRKVVKSAEKEKMLKQLKKLHPADYQLANFSVTDERETEKPLVINYMLSPEERLSNNILYLKPILINHFTENPFKNETRSVPVELAYPHSYHLTISLKIPAGYQVQELPTSFRLAMPNRLAEFSYLASNNNQFIQIRTTVNFKTALIPNEFYGDLREFYTHVIAKYNEQVVLKKI